MSDKGINVAVSLAAGGLYSLLAMGMANAVTVQQCDGAMQSCIGWMVEACTGDDACQTEGIGRCLKQYEACLKKSVSDNWPQVIKPDASTQFPKLRAPPTGGILDSSPGFSPQGPARTGTPGGGRIN